MARPATPGAQASFSGADQLADQSGLLGPALARSAQGNNQSSAPLTLAQQEAFDGAYDMEPRRPLPIEPIWVGDDLDHPFAATKEFKKSFQGTQQESDLMIAIDLIDRGELPVYKSIMSNYMQLPKIGGKNAMYVFLFAGRSKTRSRSWLKCLLLFA